MTTLSSPFLILLFLTFVLTPTLSLRDHQIGQRSVLLPVDYGAAHRVQHLMEAFGGCYIWTTTEPSILKLTPLTTDNNDCESKVLIEVQKEGEYSGPLYISAIDRDTKQIMKVIVKLSKLSRIEILTKFRLMNLFQIQEFYLIGYDEFGNSFSSLEGLKFDWKIDQSLLKNKVAEIITIKESNIFQDTNYRRSLEESGYHTDMLVIKTLNIGEIDLSVRLNQYNYDNIHTSIKLSVQERFTVQPSSPVYMILGSRVRLNLLNTKDEKLKLPISYYKYDISPSTFHVSDDLIVTSPDYETEARLIVKDMRTEPPYTNEVQIFNIPADQIQIICKSHIIVGNNEQFKIQLYNKRKLLKGSVNVELDSDFYINRENSSFVASGKTVGYIKAVYNGLVHQKRIVANLPLKMVLIGDKIVLPVGQTFQIKVVGGSGQYEYELVDFKGIATINQNGVIKTNSVGKSLVVIKDSNDNSNKIEVELVVDGVKLIRSFDEKLEAGLNEQLTMLAIAQPEHEKQFTQCNELNIVVSRNDIIENTKQDNDATINTILKIHENARKNPQLNNVLDIFRQGRDFNLNDYRDYIVHDQIPLTQLERLLFIQDNFGICKAVRAKAVQAKDGESTFEILNQKENSYLSTPFKVKIYRDLGIRDYISNRVLLTPGSYFIWRSTQNNADGSIYYLNDIKVRQGDPISLTCSQAGETHQYNIKVIHPISQKLPRPYTREIKVIVQCLHPSSLKFKENEHVIDGNRLYVTGDTPFELQLKGFDHLGREFYNISSLEFNWQVDGLNKNEINRQENIYKFSYTDKYYNPSINVKTTGSRYHGIHFPEIETNLQVIRGRPFELAFYGKPIINSLTLVAPNAKQILNIIGGSQNFEVRSSNNDLLKVNFINSDKTIQMQPLKKGSVKLFITDLDQYGRPTTQINVKIVNIGKLRIKSNATLVEEGSIFRLDYTLQSQNDIIDQSQSLLLNIIPRYDCSLQQLSNKTFRALRRGHCSITASLPSHHISSENSIELEIFPKFSINIPNIIQDQRNGVRYYTGETRIPLGCNSTLMFLGGPFGAGKLSYQANPSKYLNIEELNLRTFRLIGQRKGTAEVKFILTDGNTDISIIKINVIVKELDSNIGVSPSLSRQIHQKATVHITPQLYIDNHKILHSRCPIKYQWKTDNENVISIKRWNNQQGIIQSIGLNITGIQKGTAKLELIPQWSYQRLNNQYLIFDVIEVPQIAIATYIHQIKGKPISLLLPLNSKYSISSNYIVDTVSPCENLMKVNGNEIETFNDKGGSIIKLRSQNSRENSISYMSVQVEKIYSIFIENPLGKINIQLDTEVRIPFYIQDSYGRLFPNNLKNIGYDLRVSNPQIISAELSENLQQIIIRGYASGHSELYISITQNPDIYDTVLIETTLLLTPISPVDVHIGGNVEFKSINGFIGQWKSENPIVMQIDKKTGRALALKQGSTQIGFSYGVEYKSKVNVYRVTSVEIKENADKLHNYKITEQRIELKALVTNDRGTTQLTNFQNLLPSISNNLIVNCYSDSPKWFDVQCVIQTKENKKSQAIVAYIRASKNYPQKQPMPLHVSFTFKLESGSTGQTFIQKTITLPYYFSFEIAKIDQHITLSAQNPTKIITIPTNHKLSILSDQQKSNWITQEFVPQKSHQIIKIDMRNFQEGSKAVINVWSPMTNQKQKIYTYYGSTNLFSGASGFFNGFLTTFGLVTWILVLLVIVLLLLFWNAYSKKDYIYYGKDD